MHLLALERAIERIANERIEAAMDSGDFDGLPGAGKPLPHMEEPYDPNWWVRNWMRRQNLSEGDLHRELRDTKRQNDD